MKMSALLRVVGGILLAIVLFWVWWSVAANYDYSALAGTYVFHGNGETCTLYLRADRSFVQEIMQSGKTQRSEGHWLRFGQSHASFSNEFLKLSGEEMNAEGQAHGEFDKLLGIFPSLTLAPVPGGPRLYRKVFP